VVVSQIPARTSRRRSAQIPWHAREAPDAHITAHVAKISPESGAIMSNITAVGADAASIGMMSAQSLYRPR
jgi:hypothetical protein